ncbi:ABC transporter ATP-binding protein [Bacillus thuringiensis]|uniref:ABC transporter ATP-binding protein n=1 Tax=Bacillus thuringiensis TaxID=1428 RepID=UPI0036E05D8F
MQIAVQLNNVSKRIENKTIIDNISLKVHKGEILGFLGPNGAGKTTTLRMITGLSSLTEGSIFIFGKSISTEKLNALEDIGVMFENPQFYNYMTGFQNLLYFSSLTKLVDKEKIIEIMNIVGLTEQVHVKVKKYSLGMKQRLGLAQCLINDPKVLILDEPTNGLDPIGIKELREHLRFLADKKELAIIISSHHSTEIELICDSIAIINKGKIIKKEQINEKINDADKEFLIYLDNPSKAVHDILQVHPDITIDHSVQFVRLNTNKSKFLSILITLEKNNHIVHDFKEHEKSLEDYFLEVVQGKEN